MLHATPLGPQLTPTPQTPTWELLLGMLLSSYPSSRSLLILSLSLCLWRPVWDSSKWPPQALTGKYSSVACQPTSVTPHVWFVRKSSELPLAFLYGSVILTSLHTTHTQITHKTTLKSRCVTLSFIDPSASQCQKRYDHVHVYSTAVGLG